MTKKTILSWSSGKDSAWILHLLQRQKGIEVMGLVTTVTQVHQRVAMHAVHISLLKKQAEAVNLPLTILHLPIPCSNEAYESIMKEYMIKCKNNGIKCLALGGDALRF